MRPSKITSPPVMTLANPGIFDATDAPAPNQTPTWTAEAGWQLGRLGGGQPAKLLTGLKSTSINRENCTAIISISEIENTENSAYLFGAENSDAGGKDGNDLYIELAPNFISSGETKIIFHNESWNAGLSNSVLVGSVLSECVVAIAGPNCYLNGSLVPGNITNVWVDGFNLAEIGIGSVPIYIDDVHQVGSDYSADCDFVMRSISFHNTVLTTEQVAAITTARQAL